MLREIESLMYNLFKYHLCIWKNQFAGRCQKLSVEEMNVLSHEIRQALLQKLSAHGGHFGPNFGMVEATIALHYVFHSPEDKIVFDVSHQSYTHKMLTGRKDAFLHPEQYDEVSGYSEPMESVHDHL